MTKGSRNQHERAHDRLSGLEVHPQRINPILLLTDEDKSFSEGKSGM